MRSLTFASCVLVLPVADAALLAHVETDKGTIVVDLKHGVAPKAVANFMTLATGTRARLDPVTGAPTREPLYVGEKFFRTGDNDFSKFAQTGSGTGSNAAAAGFTFRDEFDPSLRHEGYTLSMANSGPNTNGGQIFFTGNISIPSYDNRHTIFGLVTDATSRSVVDAIIAAGDNGSEILSISFERTDPEAQAFDELAQNLPTVEVPDGRLRVVPGESARFELDPPASLGDVVTAFRSFDLGTWNEVASEHLGIGPVSAIEPPSLGELAIDGAAESSAFYHLSVARHPGAVAPSDFAFRALDITLAGNVYRFAFDGTGEGGTVTCTAGTDEPVSGPFSLINSTTGAHHFLIITDSASIASSRIPRHLQIRFGADSEEDGVISGRHLSYVWLGYWGEYSPGTATISR